MIGLSAVAVSCAFAMAVAGAPDASAEALKSIAIGQSTARESETPKPISADTHLDEAATPKGSVCTVMGSGRPFQDRCLASEVTVSASLDGKDSVATVEPSAVQVRFDLLDTTDTAWAVVESKGVRVRAYWPLAHETFRLRREASALEGHAHMTVGTAVGVRWISHAGIAVHAEASDFNLDDLDTRASCNALSFEPFNQEEKPAPDPDPRAKLMTPTGSRLPLFTASTGPGEFVLESGSTSPIAIDMQVIAHWDKRYLVDFRTAHVRFDVWVDEKDVAPSEMPLGDFGRGIGCGIGDATSQRPSTLRHPAAALVAALPFENQSSSVHFDKDTEVFREKSIGGWTAVRPARSAIQPPKGKSFWIPTSTI